MTFLRSRLAMVGALIAVPVLQFGGCAPQSREYGPTTGPGGENGDGATGGTSGKGSGGTGNGGTLAAGGSGATGGSSAGGSSSGDAGMAGDMTGTGGVSASGGSTAGGSGGTTGGKGGAAGKGGTGGKGGSAGKGGAGGKGGSAGSGAVCVPTGVEDCSDGIDNDCDGETDCLTLKNQFPDPNGAASGADVEYAFGAQSQDASFQCRLTHGTTVPADAPWGDCGAATSGGKVSPFTSAMSADPTKNGLWTTEVRLSFPDDSVSAPFSRTVYIHNSLNGAVRCTPQATDEDYLTIATPNLADAGAFVTTTVKSPFVQVNFAPPVSSTFAVTSSDGTIEMRSLRRRFSFSSDKHYLIITRNYESRDAVNGMGCNAVEKRVHDSAGSWALGHDSYQTCAALVLNKSGAGFCLTVVGAMVTSAEHVRGDYGAQVPAPTYSPTADNFAWRKLVSRTSPGILTNFSPKCDDVGCDTSGALYLPDKSFFPYW